MARSIIVNLPCCISLALLAMQGCTTQSARKPNEDAWPLYSKAVERVEEGYRAKIMPPVRSDLIYANFPPFSAEWYGIERATYAFNAPARALLREARTRSVAHWPASPAGEKPNVSYFSQCRALADEAGDAALYEHLQGDDAAAIETVRDELHLAKLLDESSSTSEDISLVALGIRLHAIDRLERITSELSLANDRTDRKRLQVRVVRELIRQLFNGRDPGRQVADLRARDSSNELVAEQHKRFLTTILQRGQMEGRLAAMLLACHLFRHDQSRWPASVMDIVKYLPAEPTDAWGKLGYALVKAPDGADRPLVYSRCLSKDGLFYRTDEPQYEFYQGDGSNLPTKQQKEGGQFRDVTLWAVPAVKPSPTTRPLQ